MSGLEEFSKLASVQKCPVCGGKLDRGYVIPPRGIAWDTKKHEGGVTFVRKLVPVVTWKLKNLPALKCEHCGIAIFDYSKV